MQITAQMVQITAQIVPICLICSNKNSNKNVGTNVGMIQDNILDGNVFEAMDKANFDLLN